MSIIYIEVIIDMHSLIKIIEHEISTYREKQGNSRKKIDIENFELHVIKRIGSEEKYKSHGGYKEFYRCILDIKVIGILKPINSCKENNNKKPSLTRFWWIEPKYSSNQWNENTIANLSTLLDITFYIRNKKYQTSEELKKLECLYSYLRNRSTNFTLSREERSLNIFKNISGIFNYEPEKYLSSSEGKTLLNRLKLTYEDLNCEIVREPFMFWINNRASNNDKFEVLIVEGLATYHTLKKILKKGIKCKLGPTPYILIWGAGRRIEGTIHYLHDIVKHPEELVIRYAGDIDYEGLDIFHSLKNKNKNLNIVLATHFYDFSVCYGMDYAKKISTNQRRNDSVFHDIQSEFPKNSTTFSKLQHIWFNKMRIAQEFINFDTLMKEGWIHYA